MRLIFFLFWVFWVVSLSSLSCKNEQTSCDYVKSFIIKAEQINFKRMFGLSIQFRGLNKNGEKNVRGIQLNNFEKDRIILPLNMKELPKDSLLAYRPNILAFAKYYNIGKVDTIMYLNGLVDSLVSDFNTLNIYSLNSQLHLGEFIEFEISPNCSIWFKQEGARLNETYSVLFKEATKIQKNWYLIKRRNLGPVLKNHPGNMEINDY